MAALIWTVPALSDLDRIADYIALEDPEAAERVVQRVFRHIEQLAEQPESGSKPVELRGLPYRQIVEPPCRIFYRYDGKRVIIFHVIRGEKLLRKRTLIGRDRQMPGPG